MRVVPRIIINYPSRHISKDICRDFFARSNEEDKMKADHSNQACLNLNGLISDYLTNAVTAIETSESEFLWPARSNEEDFGIYYMSFEKRKECELWNILVE